MSYPRAQIHTVCLQCRARMPVFYCSSKWHLPVLILGSEPAQCEEEPDGNTDLDVSMLSLDPPSEMKDVNFVPPTSTSALNTTTNTVEEEQPDM